MSWFADPYERAPLVRRGHSLANDAGEWPILGGVPFLVPEPARWLAARRDPVLAALAEAGLARRPDVQRFDALVRGVRVAPIGLPDDFLANEDAAIEIVDGPAAGALRTLLRERHTLFERLAARCARGPVLEIGPGSGALTRRIAGRPLHVIDHSPRALLRATRDLDAEIAVVDLDSSFPVAVEHFGTVVAANVLDVVADPARLLDEIAVSLVPGGTVVCSTPDPAFAPSAGEDALADLLASAGLRIVDDLDGIPWLRVHSAREIQVFVARVVVAERPTR